MTLTPLAPSCHPPAPLGLRVLVHLLGFILTEPLPVLLLGIIQIQNCFLSLFFLSFCFHPLTSLNLLLFFYLFFIILLSIWLFLLYLFLFSFFFLSFLLYIFLCPESSFWWYVSVSVFLFWSLSEFHAPVNTGTASYWAYPDRVRFHY